MIEQKEKIENMNVIFYFVCNQDISYLGYRFKGWNIFEGWTKKKLKKINVFSPLYVYTIDIYHKV